MTNTIFHLIVEKGPNKGREISVTPSGIRIGRSSRNDVVLNDPAMSRFHCRVYFKPGEGLWAEDLGSANRTMLNGNGLQKERIHIGDQLTMGDTTLKVVNDSPLPSTAADLFATGAGKAHPDQIDILRAPGKKERARKSATRILLSAGFVLTVVALLAVVIRVNKILQHPIQTSSQLAESGFEPLEINYIKIQASPKNIFRYDMELKKNELSIQIDDLQNQRHIAKDQCKKIDAELGNNLVKAIQDSGFFELKAEYRGLASDVWDVLDLSITIGKKAHRVKIVNRTEPDIFRTVREMIEEFGQNELGLAALALSHEKLLELAHDAWLLGRNLYDQREIKNENLARAISCLKEVQWYLETIEPKPDYYKNTIALQADCEHELREIYGNHLFLANRAIKLREWSEAAKQLQLIREKIPDGSDQRHQNARRKLIDVERRLKKK